MKKLIFIIILSVIQISIQAQVTWIFNKDTIITYYYQDGDEFESTTLNTKKWNYSYGWARSIIHQSEQQYYTDGKNHTLSNGCLNLFAVKEKINARVVDWLPDTDSIKNGDEFFGFNKHEFNYSAGMIQSEKKYQYGYFEIKFKLPKNSGYWPAFWLYGGTPNEEIDWMELKTEDVNAIHVGRHSKIRAENRMKVFLSTRWWGGNVYFKGNLTKGFNIISGEWTPEYLKYYLNGECIAYTKLNLPEPKNLCANIAVPSNNGPFKPGPDKNTINSGNFEIDYIRVWSKNKSEAISFPKTIAQIDSTNKPIMTSKLKNKCSPLYGKKSIHKNEGIIISITPNQNKKHTLQTLGKNIPKDAKYQLLSKSGAILFTDILKYGEQTINLQNYTENEITLKITCYNKIASYQLK